MTLRLSAPRVRESLVSDGAALAVLYPAAFPEETLLPLVSALLDRGQDVLSLVAVSDATIAGHAVFTMCAVTGGTARAALLGPVAVAPALQRRGIGGALIRDGLRRLTEAGVARVFVLGNPAYYGRFGFTRDDKVAPPYRLPLEWQGAWQSIFLGGAVADMRGTLVVPEPWRVPALWGG